MHLLTGTVSQLKVCRVSEQHILCTKGEKHEQGNTCNVDISVKKTKCVGNRSRG